MLTTAANLQRRGCGCLAWRHSSQSFGPSLSPSARWQSPGARAIRLTVNSFRFGMRSGQLPSAPIDTLNHVDMLNCESTDPTRRCSHHSRRPTASSREPALMLWTRMNGPARKSITSGNATNMPRRLRATVYACCRRRARARSSPFGVRDWPDNNQRSFHSRMIDRRAHRGRCVAP
jgi:hypothetical protein